MAVTTVVSNVGGGTYTPGTYTPGTFSVPGTSGFVAIGSISNANPCVVTTPTNHGFVTGDLVYVMNIVDDGTPQAMAQLNWQWGTVTKIDNRTLSLPMNTIPMNAYTSGGTLVKASRFDVKVDATQLTDPGTMVKIRFTTAVGSVIYDGGESGRSGEPDAGTNPRKAFIPIGGITPLPTGLQVTPVLQVSGGSFTTAGATITTGS